MTPEAKARQNIDALGSVSGWRIWCVFDITQFRIVAEVDRYLPIVGEVEAEVSTKLKRAQALLQGALKKAITAMT